MFQYIIRRIFYFLPTLLIISVIVFGMSKCTPNDPCIPQSNTPQDRQAFIECQKRFGLTGPAFYFNITSQAYPDSLHKIAYKRDREQWSNLIAQYGNWNEISKYKDALQTTQLQLIEIPDSIAPDEIIQIRKSLSFLYVYEKDKDIQRELDSIHVALNNSPALSSLSLIHI